jgi:hypothetical protein
LAPAFLLLSPVTHSQYILSIALGQGKVGPNQEQMTGHCPYLVCIAQVQT